MARAQHALAAAWRALGRTQRHLSAAATLQRRLGETHTLIRQTGLDSTVCFSVCFIATAPAQRWPPCSGISIVLQLPHVRCVQQIADHSAACTDIANDAESAGLDDSPPLAPASAVLQSLHAGRAAAAALCATLQVGTSVV